MACTYQLWHKNLKSFVKQKLIAKDEKRCLNEEMQHLLIVASMIPLVVLVVNLWGNLQVA